MYVSFIVEKIVISFVLMLLTRLYNTYRQFYQRYFNFIVDISFIGRGNWSIGTKTTDMLQVGNKDLSHYILSSISHIDLHVSKVQFEVVFYF